MVRQVDEDEGRHYASLEGLINTDEIEEEGLDMNLKPTAPSLLTVLGI